MAKLAPYLFFTTQCEAALAFYTRCGLGSVQELVRYGDNNMPVRTKAFRGKIMHAEFTGPGVHFFASDNDDAEPMKGSALLLMPDDFDQARKLFALLQAKGRVTVPFDVKLWGDHFGMVVDQFGVQWMLNYAAA